MVIVSHAGLETPLTLRLAISGSQSNPVSTPLDVSSFTVAAHSSHPPTSRERMTPSQGKPVLLMEAVYDPEIIFAAPFL